MGRRGDRSRVALVLALSFSIAAISPITGSGSVGAAPVQRVLFTGVADVSGARGPAWRRINFNAARTGAATVAVSWTGTADIKFNVLTSTGVRIGGNSSTTNPKSASVNLTAGTAYYVALWAANSFGTYTLTLTENFPDTDGTPPSPPAGLASPGQTSTSIALSWTASRTTSASPATGCTATACRSARQPRPISPTRT